MKANLIVLALAATVSPLQAQSVRVADSLLQSGSLVRAESVYYAAVRVRPRDPIARWALGRFLVSRGAPRVGATLFEESLQFGGEPTIVGRDLVPVYLAIGEYGSLAKLAAATPAERDRAKWLVAHETRVVSPDSAVVAMFTPSTDSTVVGRIPIRVNGHTIDAVISARVQGIIISDSALAARALHKFTGTGERGARASVLATADSIGIGRLSLKNYPVTVVHVDDKQSAMIGLDVLGKFAPVFEPKAGRVTLHVGGVIPANALGVRLQTLSAASDLRIMQGGGWVSVTRPQIAKLLRDHAWTLDSRRGQLILAP